MTTENKKTIILLTPPYNLYSEQLRQELKHCCMENNFIDHKFIQTRTHYDCRALKRIIKTANKQHSQGKHVTVII